MINEQGCHILPLESACIAAFCGAQGVRGPVFAARRTALNAASGIAVGGTPLICCL
jgi:hypothetical protein